MSRAEASDFDALFKQATGREPFPYQRAFATSTGLPDLVRAPTGAGKTATAVLGWLWRRRYAAAEIRAATPRRLIFCLPMRTLVEQTERVTRGWLAHLGLGDDVGVHGLLGGAVDDSWESYPSRDAVLIGTQEQLLSRALNRGFAMSRYRWPVHFGLLNNDCLWIMDEVQLMGVGLSTSTQMQAFREQLKTTAPCRSVWMSATLDEASLATVDFKGRASALTQLSLTEADRTAPGLAGRLNARKRLEAASFSLGAGQSLQEYSARFTSEVLAAHVPGTLTLVVLNRVVRAQALYRELVTRAGGRLPLGLIHSRFRPADRRRTQEQVLGSGWSGILVATQAVEAGVDISARTLFTELAPWPSLVQRFGRCNRMGEFGEGEATLRWVDVSPEEGSPYKTEDLDVARVKLAGLDDAGPARLESIPTESAAPALPILRRRDLLELFDTQPDLAGHDLDVSRYIRATDDRDVQVAWRAWDGDTPPQDSAEPHRDELCNVSVDVLRKFLGKSKAYRWAGLEGQWESVSAPVPGMMILLPADEGGYSATLGWTADHKDRPTAVEIPAVPPDADEAEALSYQCTSFVTLATHSEDVADELRGLATALGDSAPWGDLERAARWHDLGKVHDCFQTMLLSGLPADDSRRTGGPWAKSDGTRAARNQRRHFRHELASALALLAQGGSDLQAFLVAAHHGKVRLSIRARPTEPAAPEGRRFALGVWDGDVLPATDLGSGVRSAETPLSLELMELGEGSGGASWLARMLALREAYGPFRLAYWETLVRIADWRGTARHQSREEPK